MCCDPDCDAIGVETTVPTGDGTKDSAGGGNAGGLDLATGAGAAAGGGPAAAAMGAKVAVPVVFPSDAGGPNGDARALDLATSASNDQGSGEGTLLAAVAGCAGATCLERVSRTLRRSLRTFCSASARLAFSALATSSLSASFR